MLELAPRTDLSDLTDSELAQRLDRAIEALETMKKRYGFLYFFHSLSWTLRTLVSDPRTYWYPSHVEAEIRDIQTEIEHRIGRRKQAVL